MYLFKFFSLLLFLIFLFFLSLSMCRFIYSRMAKNKKSLGFILNLVLVGVFLIICWLFIYCCFLFWLLHVCYAAQ